MTIKCLACESENPDDSKFCSECGAPLEASKNVSVTKTFQSPLSRRKKDTVISGKYKIIEKLGEGGMGVVYKAKDIRLDRTVALKFLPSEMTKDPEAKKRFIQEAKSAAALDHPNICTVYEVDEADGQTFISMSYIQGQNLKDKLKEGPMDIDESKDIALQVAEGLKEAHEKGIIHRDIKPANIMLTEKGQAKITDFGLAKLSWGIDLTKTSTVMGTAAYMSPEQARGDKVDHRTDVWSLGAMFYEMLSGKRPFQRDQEQASIFAVINDKPTPLSLIRTDISAHIENVIEKAMAKKADQRHRKVSDFIQDLIQSQVDSPSKSEKSIIVLPFEDISPDKDNEYFSDGLTEEIITDLSHIHDLLVISRSSAMTFKGSKKKVRDIAGEVNVRYVLEGSVRKAGNHLRITAQLIDAEKDVHLWAEKYAGTLDDVFDIQEKVSLAIAEALKIQLTPVEKHEIDDHPLTDMKAYDCYLRAKQEYLHYTEESLETAIALIQEGLQSVGENALLYSLLGQVYWTFVNVGIRLDAVWLDRAEACVKKIFALDKGSAQGYFLQGLIDYKRGDTQVSVRHTKLALEKDPAHSDAIDHLLWMYADAGRTEQSEPYIKRILEIDPFTPHNHWVIGWIRVTQGDFAAGLPYFEKTHTMDPANPIWRLLYAHQLYLNGKMKEGDAVVNTMDRETPGEMLTSMALLFRHAFRGDKKKALSHITDDMLLFGRWDELIAWMLAQAYALLEEKEEALRWLDHAADRGFINYPFFNEIDPCLENIRGEARFKKLMKRVKKEWENFEV